jgi:hypothetical protein
MVSTPVELGRAEGGTVVDELGLGLDEHAARPKASATVIAAMVLLELRFMCVILS